MRAHDLQLLEILLAEKARSAGVWAKSLATTVATPSKWPGRCMPSITSVRPATDTVVQNPSGYICSPPGDIDGIDARSAPAWPHPSSSVRGYFGEILGRVELLGIHEDRHDHPVAIGLGGGAPATGARHAARPSSARRRRGSPARARPRPLRADRQALRRIGALMTLAPALRRQNMLGRGKCARAHLGGIGGDRRFGLLAQLGIAFDEFRPEGGEQAQHVVDDQDLSVAARPRRRCRWSGSSISAVIRSASDRRHLFEHDGKGAGLGHRRAHRAESACPAVRRGPAPCSRPAC